MTGVPDELGALRQGMGACLVVGRNPLSGIERVRGRIDRRRDGLALCATGKTIDALYPIDRHWEQNLHDVLARPWPCRAAPEADALWAETTEALAADGLDGPFQGGCDGRLSFARAAWCLTQHLKPQTVVETGVARGITTSLILEALAESGSGRLWSIDMPSLDPRCHAQVGAAVPDVFRERWVCLTGTYRYRLPKLLARLGAIDLFVHDSLHTGRNARFELEHAWRVLRPGGAVLVDDIYQSVAWHEFVRSARPRWATIGAQPDGGYRFGIALKE